MQRQSKNAVVRRLLPALKTSSVGGQFVLLLPVNLWFHAHYLSVKPSIDRVESMKRVSY